MFRVKLNFPDRKRNAKSESHAMGEGSPDLRRPSSHHLTREDLCRTFKEKVWCKSNTDTPDRAL